MTASLLATAANAQIVVAPPPDCDTAQADMSKAIDAATAAVNQVLVKSAAFRAIMAKEPDVRKEELKFFCRKETFATYDAADAAFDNGITRAQALRHACPASAQQASTTLSRLTSMRLSNDTMRLRLRGICGAPRITLSRR